MLKPVSYESLMKVFASLHPKDDDRLSAPR